MLYYSTMNVILAFLKFGIWRQKCYNITVKIEVREGDKRSMNLKEYKSKMETVVKQEIGKLFNEKVDVETSYDIESSVMRISLKEVRYKDEKDSVIDRILFYSFLVGETGISFMGISRVFYYDDLSVIAIINEPVMMDENLINTIKAVTLNAEEEKESKVYS